MSLDSGIIRKRSYRSVRPYLKPSYYNLPLEMRESLQAAHPLSLSHGPRDPNLAHTSQASTDIFDSKAPAHTEALRNILTVFSRIADSLPKLGPSEPTTYFLDDPQDDEPITPQKTVTIEEPADVNETNNNEMEQTDEFNYDEPNYDEPENTEDNDPSQTDETRRPQRNAGRPARYKDFLDLN